MNISWLSLRDLEYVVAVAENEHFGRAATSCHVSQPALSSQIKKLEDLLGVKLFERSKRHVSLTAAGGAVVTQARIVLDEARKITELAKNRLEPLTGTFRLGAIATLGPYLIPHFLGALRRKYPRLELLLREGLTEGLIAELRAGTIEGVLASPTFDSQGLLEIPLFVEPFVVAVPREHPLAKKHPLRPSDLRASEMILLEDGHCLRDQTLEICPVRGKGGAKQYHATSLETLRHLVGSGLGYTVIPWLAVREDRKLQSVLVYREFDGKPLGRTISLYCRERFARMDEIRELTRFFRSHLPPGVIALKPS